MTLFSRYLKAPLLLALLISGSGCGVELLFVAGIIKTDGGGADGGAPADLPTKPVVQIPPQSFEDKTFTIDLSTGFQDRGEIQSVSLINAPSWLVYDQQKKKITGNPIFGHNLSGFQFTVNVGSNNYSYGPFSISTLGDPFRKQQWHMENIGQQTYSSSSGIPGVDLKLLDVFNQDITGKNVRVAVSDSGIEIAHEDLSANIISGASKNYSLSAPFIGDPTPPTIDGLEAHGTAVAGIIAAKGWNGLGGKGVAPDAKIAGLRFLNLTQTTAAKIDQASGAFDIFNYSYGASGIYPTSPEDAMPQIIFGTKNLRNGKGAIYVKSAGNSFAEDFKYDSTLGLFNCFNVGAGVNGICSFFGNANLNGDENTYPHVITVGAVNASGAKASYSNPGSNIWISSFGGEDGTFEPAILTTDIQGCNKGLSSTLVTPYANTFEQGLGENTNCKYTSAMNGTSSATPMVSGIGALLLEANPNLTWRDVKYILAATADKVDPTASSTPHPQPSLSLAGHTYQLGWTQNSAGFWFHNFYGFGLANAKKAIDLAKIYSGSLGTFKETKDDSGNWLYTSGTLNSPIPDAASSGVSSSINVKHNFTIEGVQIQFLTTHEWITDLGVELTSPAGTKSILLNINSGIFKGTPTSYDAQLLSNAFFGENSNGNWTIKIIDGAAGDTGNLVDWKINIYGYVKSPQPDVTAPLPVASLTHAATQNSSTTSPLISFTGSSSSDVMRYEYSIGSSAGGTSIRNWTSVGSNTSFTAQSLLLTINQTYYVNVRAIDSSENISSVVSSTGWLYTAAAAPTILISSPSVLKMNATGSTVFTVSYSGATAITLTSSDVNLTQVGVTCTKAVAGSGTTTRTVTLTSCTGDGTVRISIAANSAVNSVGVQAGSSGLSSTATIDNTAPSISSLANDAVATKSKTWTWSCNDSPCTYRYLIDTAPTSSPTGSFSSTASASQAAGTGTYYIHVQAQDSSGNTSAIVHFSAVIDNTAPIVTGLSNDAAWRATKTSTWGCNKAPCTYRFLIDTSSSTSPSAVYSATITATQSSGTGTYYIHVQAKDSIGNESTVSHASFKLDNTAPTAPSSASLASSFSQSLISSPVITYGSSTDADSGIQKYQARVVQVSNSSLIKDWTDQTSGAVLAGLSLVTNTQYRLEVSALDNLGNRSATISTVWLADATPPSAPAAGITIGSTPFDLNSTPTLTWNIPTDTSGSGISFYEVRLKKSSDNSIIQDWTTKLRGDSFSGLGLSDDTNHYFEIRATDNANNVSSVANSANWKTNYHYYQKVSQGNQSTCGLTLIGSVKCWGQLAGIINSTFPKTVTGLESNVTDLSAGNGHTCVVQAGAAKCFGFNNNGQLGDGTTTNSTGLVNVSGLSSGVTKITAGDQFSCAIQSGASKCWGGANALGNGTSTPSLTPSNVLNSGSGVTNIVAGANHACQIRSGLVECWGWNGSGSVYGSPASTTITSPVQITEVSLNISAGNSKTCGINSSGAALCWGYGGVIGNGSDSGTPTIVPTLTSGVTKVFAFLNRSYAINSSGSLLGWGVGHVGTGTSGTYSTPVVIIASNVIDLSIGVNGAACALLNSNLLKCWGDNSVGQLGDGTTTTRNVPTDVVNF